MAPPPGIADILPLTPLQEGLYFHLLASDGAADAYVVQTVLHVEAATLDEVRLRAAAEALLERHPQMRAAFRTTERGRSLQVLPRTVRLPWDSRDLRGPDADAAADRLADAERATGFDVAVSPLMRFVVARVTDTGYRLMITAHHILWDGWSEPLLVRDLFALYAGTPLPSPRPYKDYLAWLGSQDKEAALAAWTRALRGVDGPTLLVPDPDRAGGEALPREHVVRLDRADTAALSARGAGGRGHPEHRGAVRVGDRARRVHRPRRRGVRGDGVGSASGVGRGRGHGRVVHQHGAGAGAGGAG